MHLRHCTRGQHREGWCAQAIVKGVSVQNRLQAAGVPCRWLMLQGQEPWLWVLCST